MSFTLRELWGEGKREVGSSVADPDPGSGAYSGIRNRFFSDPSSRISGPGTTPATGAIFFGPRKELGNPGSRTNPFRIPDPGVKKAPDPDSQQWFF